MRATPPRLSLLDRVGLSHPSPRCAFKLVVVVMASMVGALAARPARADDGASRSAIEIVDLVTASDIGTGFARTYRAGGYENGTANFANGGTQFKASHLLVTVARHSSVAAAREAFERILGLEQRDIEREVGEGRSSRLYMLPVVGPRAYVKARADATRLSAQRSKHDVRAIWLVGFWRIEVGAGLLTPEYTIQQCETLAIRILRLIQVRSGLTDEEEMPLPTPRLRLKVTASLHDEDREFTPADEADLDVRIDGAPEGALVVEMELVGPLAKPERQMAPGGAIAPQPALAFRIAGASRVQTSTAVSASRGSSASLRTRLRVANEDQAYIWRTLMSVVGDRDDMGARKPDPEVGIALDAVLRVRVRPGDGDEMLLEELVPIQANGAVARIVYPRLTSAAGLPPNALARAYYLNGDGFDPVANPALRAVALRAARTPVGRTATVDDLLPEGDVGVVVTHIAHYVHAQLMPKAWPVPVVPAADLAGSLYPYQHVPGEIPEKDETWWEFFRIDRRKTGWACIEHAVLLNTLVRALGIAAREVNVLQWITVPVVSGFFSSQDASSEVWYDGRWNYWSLFGDQPVRSLEERYGGRSVTYEAWAGARAYVGSRPVSHPDGYQSRFTMRSLAMHGDPAWEFIGYGGPDGFTRTEAPPLLSWLPLGVGPYVVYRFHSPVVAAVRLKDGRLHGATGRVPVTDAVRRYYMLGGVERPPELPAYDQHVAWFPEGLEMFPDASGAEGGHAVPQTLVVRADPTTGQPVGTLVLTAIGTGPWRMEASRLDVSGIQHYVPHQGEVHEGQVVEIAADHLQPLGPAEPWPEAPLGETVDPGAPDTAFLGVIVHPVDEITKQAVNTEPGHGAIVAHVVPDSAAAEAGLRPFDVITSIAGTPVTTAQELIAVVTRFRPGDIVHIAVKRTGVLQIRLGARPSPTPRTASPAQTYTVDPDVRVHFQSSAKGWAAGYRMSTVAGGTTGWLSVFTQDREYELQAQSVVPTVGEALAAARRHWDAGWRIKALAGAPAAWLLIYSRGSGGPRQTLLMRPTWAELVADLVVRTAEGQLVMSLAVGPDGWAAVVTPAPEGAAPRVGAYATWDAARVAIEAAWARGEHVVAAASEGERLVLTFVRGMFKEQRMLLDQGPALAEGIRALAAQDFRISAVASLGANWLVLLSRP